MLNRKLLAGGAAALTALVATQASAHTGHGLDATFSTGFVHPFGGLDHILAMIAATAATGALLAWATPVDGLTAYLATTPGGLFAVLSTAADAGSDVTYVLAVQLCRLLVILALTPLLARWLSARRG